MTQTILANPLNKRMSFFYAVELLSAIAFTVLHGFSGLIWLAVFVSYVGIIAKLPFMQDKLSIKTRNLITQICLIFSSIIWGYIILYSLNSLPVIYTSILVARVIATIVAFKEIRDHVIVVLPLLVGFALLKPAGCVPPLAF
jgi:hypothetical protein